MKTEMVDGVKYEILECTQGENPCNFCHYSNIACRLIDIDCESRLGENGYLKEIKEEKPIEISGVLYKLVKGVCNDCDLDIHSGCGGVCGEMRDDQIFKKISPKKPTKDYISLRGLIEQGVCYEYLLKFMDTIHYSKWNNIYTMKEILPYMKKFLSKDEYKEAFNWLKEHDYEVKDQDAIKKEIAELEARIKQLRFESGKN